MEVFLENNKLRIQYEGRSAVSHNSLVELRELINKKLEKPSDTCEPTLTESIKNSESASTSHLKRNSADRECGENFVKPKKYSKPIERSYARPISTENQFKNLQIENNYKSPGKTQARQTPTTMEMETTRRQPSRPR